MLDVRARPCQRGRAPDVRKVVGVDSRRPIQAAGEMRERRHRQRVCKKATRMICRSTSPSISSFADSPCSLADRPPGREMDGYAVRGRRDLDCATSRPERRVDDRTAIDPYTQALGGRVVRLTETSSGDTRATSTAMTPLALEDAKPQPMGGVLDACGAARRWAGEGSGRARRGRRDQEEFTRGSHTPLAADRSSRCPAKNQSARCRGLSRRRAQGSAGGLDGTGRRGGIVDGS